MKKTQPMYYPGLANLGNTCFINSCIQILNSIHEIQSLWAKYFIHLNPTSPYSPILIEWEELKKSMQTTDCVAINPDKFLQCIYRLAKKKKSWLQQWQQNDATEFFTFMLECFHEAVKRPVVIRLNGKITGNRKDSLAYSCYSMLKKEYEKEYSEFNELFHGIQYSSLYFVGNENEKSLCPQFYLSLDLPIPIKRDAITLFDCLDEYCKPEILDGDNACWNEKTGKRDTAVKQICFWNFPKILCITLQRFSPITQNKNTELVYFPFHLDLSDYASCYRNKEHKYELFGICNHMGGIGGGHYTSFVKSGEDGVWRYFNDTQVGRITNTESMVTPMAYGLFYRKIM